MGVPYIAVLLFWALWLLLVPVIAIEAIVISKRLSLTARTASGISILANIASSFVGSVLMFVNEIVFSEAGFEPMYGWPAKIPFFVILIPSYFISVWIEAHVAMPIIKNKPYREISKVFYVANLYSYTLLAILGMVITMGPS